jgi:hypothetical protein
MVAFCDAGGLFPSLMLAAVLGIVPALLLIQTTVNDWRADGVRKVGSVRSPGRAGKRTRPSCCSRYAQGQRSV